MDYVGVKHDGKWIYRPASASSPVDEPSPAKLLTDSISDGRLQVRLEDGYSGSIKFDSESDLGIAVAESGPGSDGIKLATAELGNESPCVAMFHDGTFMLAQYVKKGHYKAVRLPENAKSHAIILTPNLRFYSVSAAPHGDSNVLRVHDNKHVASWLTQKITGKSRFEVEHFGDSFTILDSRSNRKFIGKLKASNNAAAEIEIEDMKHALASNGIAPVAFSYPLRRG